MFKQFRGILACLQLENFQNSLNLVYSQGDDRYDKFNNLKFKSQNNTKDDLINNDLNWKPKLLDPLDKKIVVDPFCYKLFADKVQDKSSIFINWSVANFEIRVNQLFKITKLLPGYADFCKHLIIYNFTNAKVKHLSITEENQHLLKSTYEARNDKELPVLKRYFPKEAFEDQIALYLDIILYSRSQIEKEQKAMNIVDPNKDIPYEWGIVSVKTQNENFEIPMEPITMMRNALGVEHGGSGIQIDRDKYMESVKYWQTHAILK